jgi:pyruvate kinase
MLSGETTVGKYPFECIRVMDSIARRVEEELAADFPEPAVFIEPRMKFMRAAVVMANEFPGARIVIFTRRGLSAAGLGPPPPPPPPQGERLGPGRRGGATWSRPRASVQVRCSELA